MNNIEISFDDFELKEFLDYMENIAEVLKSTDFKEFLAKRCITKLDEIMSDKLSSITEEDMPTNKLHEYKTNNRYKISDDVIEIYNDTTLTQAEMYWLSEKTKERYSNGISIAYVIEYGTGLVGSNDAEDWEINLPSPSKKADGTWNFKRDDKLFLKVKGTTPRFVYLTLKTEVEENYLNWVNEYLESELK